MSGATAAALTLFKKSPNNLNDPSAGYVWSGRPLAVSPVSAEVRARWLELNQKGYFSDQDGKCGEDYITGNQFGLVTEPKVTSTQANPDGTVTVVIARTPKPPPPDLTVTMTYQNGKWLATDLASGTGPSASIFSAKPNC